MAALPATGSLLGLDLAKRRIGVAGTDAGRKLVTPLVTLERRRFARETQALAKLVSEREVAGLVIGLPLNMDDSFGPQAQSVRDTGQAIAEALGLPWLLQDERLSTEEIAFAIEEGRLPRPRKGEERDHLAAALILEDALRRIERASAEAGHPPQPEPRE